MGFSFNDSFSFALSSTLNIESLNNIFFSYHVVGLALGRSHKNLLLVHICTKSSTQFYFNWFQILLLTNEYEFRFCSHDDAKHICAKMRWVMGASVHQPTPIKFPITSLDNE
jgi:hypothetical protein